MLNDCEDKISVKELKEGVKFDQGKNRYDLIPGYPLDELAKIYTYGTTKYDDNNWRKGLAWGRLFGAMMRHAWAFWRGQSLDPESGLHHLAHAAWQCFALMEYERTKPELDDRFADLVIGKVEMNKQDLNEIKIELKQKPRIYLAGTTTAIEYRSLAHHYYDNVTCFELIDPMQFEIQKTVAVVKEDKDAILTCDYVVAWIEKPTFGTVMEIEFAYMNNIPVFVLCNNQDIKQDPWLQAHTTLYFDDMIKCFKYLQQECEKLNKNK
jgi:hypothetical protein